MVTFRLLVVAPRDPLPSVRVAMLQDNSNRVPLRLRTANMNLWISRMTTELHPA